MGINRAIIEKLSEKGEHVPKEHPKRGHQAREQSIKRLHLSD
jgi:hypothetical protein